jgi:hypothetical protein
MRVGDTRMSRYSCELRLLSSSYRVVDCLIGYMVSRAERLIRVDDAHSLLVSKVTFTGGWRGSRRLQENAANSLAGASKCGQLPASRVYDYSIA